MQLRKVRSRVLGRARRQPAAAVPWRRDGPARRSQWAARQPRYINRAHLTSINSFRWVVLVKATRQFDVSSGGRGGGGAGRHQVGGPAQAGRYSVLAPPLPK